jgi:oxygen-independent coproporphyrinogen III oxidase
MRRFQFSVIKVGMWPYHPELLARPVPRYTSYPTAADFHDGVGGAEMEEALAQLSAGTAISLYIHIPYCEQICWYCGCNTGATGRKQRLDSYLQALEMEIAHLASRIGGRVRVNRLAFGGGSPNAITPIAFARLCDRILTLFRADYEELSVEIDPRIFTLDWAATLAACGVTRVSMGVQSFAEHIQKAIGRIQPLALVAKCVEWLRAAGIDAINFDLIYGLPKQSLADLEDTLAETVALKPSRIALFGYAHLPHLLPRQRRIDGSNLPGGYERFEMAAFGYEYLTSAKYVPVGFDHFALPGDPLAAAAHGDSVRRNFQGFTDDNSDVLIGLGASAISRFPDRILQNEKNSGRYRQLVSQCRLPATRGIILSCDDRDRGRIIADLLCRGEAQNIPEQIMKEIRYGLSAFAELGLISLGSSDLKAREEALPYSRLIASVFDSFRNGSGTSWSPAI